MNTAGVNKIIRRTAAVITGLALQQSLRPAKLELRDTQLHG